MEIRKYVRTGVEPDSFVSLLDDFVRDVALEIILN